ncbi:MAG: 30S ribosomal protein S17 [Chloroflexi bacterium]|nr:30S ribosomal protein S17 [Chloroflexota bacterium]
MKTNRKIRLGHVMSNKMDKTVVVAVVTHRQHPLYKKVMTHRAKFKAHDPNSECNVGDLVRIEETRPLSKEKRWRVVEIVTRGKVAEVQPKDIAPVPAESSQT